MNDREIVLQYIENLQECALVDFKEKFYPIKRHKADFLKDVVSFANNIQAKDKYIIFGIKDIDHSVCGIDPDSLPDVGILENLLFEKIEPQLTVTLEWFLFNDKKIAYIKIPRSNENIPYIIKNDCDCVKQGDVYIRKGSINAKANRRDLDDMYINRHVQTIVPYDNSIIIESISSIPQNPTFGQIDINITNFSHRPLLINSGWIQIENKFGKIERDFYYILPYTSELCIRERPFEVKAN